MLSTLTTKGQITIPVALRQQLGLGVGSAVRFTLSERGDSILISPANVLTQSSQTVKSGFGMLRVKQKTVAVDFDVASLLKPDAQPKK